MDDKLERIAAEAGKSPALADKLDQLLTGPNDRAFLVCVYRECEQNVKGECSIYTVSDVPPMKPGSPCDSYRAAPPDGAEDKKEGD
ncbi:MAG TPA: hypothetical protein VF799_00095 [Geobacteraceae bacterium]